MGNKVDITPGQSRSFAVDSILDHEAKSMLLNSSIRLTVIIEKVHQRSPLDSKLHSQAVPAPASSHNPYELIGNQPAGSCQQCMQLVKSLLRPLEQQSHLVIYATGWVPILDRLSEDDHLMPKALP